MSTSAVTPKVQGDDQTIAALANLGTPEPAHDVLGHTDTPTNVMNSAGAADPKWLSDPNLHFSQSQASALRKTYNKGGKVEKKKPQSDTKQ